MNFSRAMPVFVNSEEGLVYPSVGFVNGPEFQPLPAISYGSILFGGDGFFGTHLPQGPNMLYACEWDSTAFNMDEAACVAIGDVRARHPVLFELMRAAGAPLAQIAREILQREEAGQSYTLTVYQTDSRTQQTSVVRSWQ